MKKTVLFLVVLVGVAVIGYLTNPTEAMHREASKDKLEMIAENLLANYGIDPQVLSSLGINFQGKLVDELITNHISCDNYYVFSLTKLNWRDQSQTVGFGFFNKVYISNKVDDKIKEEVGNYIKNIIGELKTPIFDLNSLQLDF